MTHPIRLELKDGGDRFDVLVIDTADERPLFAYATLDESLVSDSARHALHALVYELNGALSSIDAVRSSRPEVGMCAKGPDGEVGRITMVDRQAKTVSLNAGAPVPWSDCSYEGA